MEISASLIVELKKRHEMHKKGLGKTYSENEVLSAARADYKKSKDCPNPSKQK